MHAFVRADDGVYRADLNAQGAAYAPVLINPNHTSRGLHAAIWVQRNIGMTRNSNQSVYAFIAAGRTLVDGRLTAGDGICIGRAVGVAATRALRLRQYFQNTQ